MNDLFKKLNVLLKASLNDIAPSESQPNRPRVRLGKRVDDDIAGLRERINEAVQYEDAIKARIREYEDEAARLDQQADQAVERGDDAGARYIIDQMRRAQQRAALAQGDLREHQRATEELIQRVNELDAAVADARRAEPQEAQPSSEARHIPDLSNVLREARETIATLGETRKTLDANAEPPAKEDDAAIDNDLERRRQRLSKR